MTEPGTEERLRDLPSVDELLRDPAVQALGPGLPRWAVVEAIREAVQAARADLRAGRRAAAPAADVLIGEVAARAAAKARAGFRRVLNATGVVLHTNLGRAPLSAAALEAIAETARGYANLEFDLARGVRGSRQAPLEALLQRLTGAEAAFVVNNNAAAVFLAINTLANGREVIISRGQLVEIGDAFRIPAVMEQAGGRLREVGTTNRTNRRDYEAAIGAETALLLRVHQSNFRMLGFTEEVPLAELVALGRAKGLPVMEDLGSGALVDLGALGVGPEPPVRESVRAGADLVTFSGDKLLGGPQAGLIVGRRDLVQRLRRNPLARAVRIEKMIVAALEATLRACLEPERAVQEIPALRMLTLPLARLQVRAESMAAAIRAACGGRLKVSVEDDHSEVGGGALPLTRLPTRVVALQAPDLPAQPLEARLRLGDPPLLGRIRDGLVLLDPRTLAEGEDAEAVSAVARALVAGGEPR
jgi:L-seryl-tRNA(Ser) seleniumtransferase